MIRVRGYVVNEEKLHKVYLRNENELEQIAKILKLPIIEDEKKNRLVVVNGKHKIMFIVEKKDYF